MKRARRTIPGRWLCPVLAVAILGGWLAPAAAADLPDPRRMTFPSPDFSPPRPQRHTLGNGLVIFLLEDHEIPIIAGQALIRTGSVLDPPGKTGLAKLMGRLLVQGGTAGLPGGRLDEILEARAIEMGSDAASQSTSLTFNALAEDGDEALSLLADVLLRPAFEAGKLELVRKKMEEDVKRVVDDPDNLAFREFRRLLYAGDPRGRSATVEELRGLTRDDVLSLHREAVRPENVILGVSGDFRMDSLLPKLERLFGGWPPSGRPRAVFPLPDPKASDVNINLLDKDLPQATIVLGHLAPPKESADYVPFMLADYILGEGGFNARLTREIRSQRGLAYSVGSFYRADMGYGVFVASAKTKNESATEVLQLILGIIRQTKEGGVTPEELAWAKEAIINGMIFRYATSQAILGEALALEYDGLPPDFIRDLKARIERATLEEVNRAAAVNYDPARSTVVVLGKESAYTGDWPPGRSVRRFGLTPRPGALNGRDLHGPGARGIHDHPLILRAGREKKGGEVALSALLFLGSFSGRRTRCT